MESNNTSRDRNLKIMRHRLSYAIYILILTTVLCACSKESNNDVPGTDNDEHEVRFTFSSRIPSGSGTPENPVQELTVERFNHYWVVFTDGSVANKIVAIVKKDCSITEQDEFMVSLSPGAYKVYGFANISDAYLESLNISEGQNMPDLTGTLFAPDARFFGNAVTTLLPVETFQSDYDSNGNMGIPMTSIGGIDVNITNAVTVTTSIEVVRMFAKIEFVFANQTGTDLTLRSQSVSNLTLNRSDGKGVIPLYNDDVRTFDFLNTAPYKTLTHSYGSGLDINSGASNVSRSFYVLESRADAITNSFMLSFDVVKKGATTTAETPLTEYMRYGLTDPLTLTAIRRNDWIRIPITFADWQMRLEARSYPPIGGYPEADIDETSSNEFIVTFMGGGDFSIRPFIHKYSDGDNWFGIDNKEKVDGPPVIDIEDTDGLFSVSPVLTSTGEIKGRLNHDKAGKKACVTISLNAITNTSPVITKTLTRKIFITQK